MRLTSVCSRDTSQAESIVEGKNDFHSNLFQILQVFSVTLGDFSDHSVLRFRAITEVTLLNMCFVHRDSFPDDNL